MDIMHHFSYYFTLVSYHFPSLNRVFLLKFFLMLNMFYILKVTLVLNRFHIGQLICQLQVDIAALHTWPM